jgi:hypothetical protein
MAETSSMFLQLLAKSLFMASTLASSASTRASVFASDRPACQSSSFSTTCPAELFKLRI